MRSVKPIDIAFAFTSLLAVGALALPFVWYWISDPFPSRLSGSIIYLIVTGEKFWAMYFRLRQRASIRPKGDWTAVTVGLAHTLVMYAAISEFYLRRHGISGPIVFQFAMICFALALTLRYWAFGELKSQWAIHVDQSEGARHLVRTGPYAFVRHPLYLAAVLEVLAIPLLIHAPVTAVLGVLIFTPLEWGRIRFEERQLRGIFGPPYDDYVSEVWALFPLPFGKRRRP
jgi:protein-S-isoprenylcysteine O-methyltransferase Ste14